MNKKIDYLNEREEKILGFLLSKIDIECEKYATKKLSKDDWISMKDVLMLKGDITENYPRVIINKKSYMVAPSSKGKYDEYYYNKLEQIIFDKSRF